MTYSEIINLCKERNELDFLFKLTKVVAETDSIGEMWGYCGEYGWDKFIREKDYLINPNKAYSYATYLGEAGLPLYELYLNQIKVPKPESSY